MTSQPTNHPDDTDTAILAHVIRDLSIAHADWWNTHGTTQNPEAVAHYRHLETARHDLIMGHHALDTDTYRDVNDHLRRLCPHTPAAWIAWSVTPI